VLKEENLSHNFSRLLMEELFSSSTEKRPVESSSFFDRLQYNEDDDPRLNLRSFGVMLDCEEEIFSSSMKKRLVESSSSSDRLQYKEDEDP
jgi:hypothetical protein